MDTTDILSHKIKTFLHLESVIYRKPLEEIIKKMLELCKYRNGESLERHIFGKNPQKLNINKFIKEKIKETKLSEVDIEELLIKELKRKGIPDKNILELLWGDIQLGKRIHASIIMWFSVYILKRPVLYIFRNMNIDQQQLQSDILGTDKFNFNIIMVKKIFDKFKEEIQKELKKRGCVDDVCGLYKKYRLPELKDLRTKTTLNKLSDKKAYNPNDIFCCLMNYKQLENINNKFTEYILNYDELVNITVLVDESDLMCPTSSNDRSHSKDIKNTTKCERLLAKLYKKVRYVLHITGTAHPFFWNITTTLSEDSTIQLPVSRIHKMKRPESGKNIYYGLMNNKIKFETDNIKNWWNYSNGKQKKVKYTIDKDYLVNINNIINKIKQRKDVKYNSLLISEEKERKNQFRLINRILDDHPNLFVIIYHGKCLRLYFNKKFKEHILKFVLYDSEISKDKRLNQGGGIIGQPIIKEDGIIFPNNYCYYDIDSKKFNIKMIYKILSIYFKHIKNINKTVITITGKYGERGYSFTSDNYDEYSLHLTDQYNVFHASINCTDISQKLRIQGKYSDKPKLIFWTRKKVENIIKIYVKWILLIEKECMFWDGHDEIRKGIQNYIMQKELFNCIETRKKRKNLKIETKPNKNGHLRLPCFVDQLKSKESQFKMINNFLKTQDRLPPFKELVNYIKKTSKEDFIKKFGKNKYDFNERREIFDSYEKYLDYINKNKLPKSKIKKNKNGFYECSVAKKKQIYSEYNLDKDLKGIKPGSNLGVSYKKTENVAEIFTRLYVYYLDTSNKNTAYFLLRVCKITGSNKVLPKNDNRLTKGANNCMWWYNEGDNIYYSVINSKYKSDHGYKSDADFIEDALPKEYYYISPNGWLYVKLEKTDSVSVSIIEPKYKKLCQSEDDLLEDVIIDKYVDKFFKDCCKKTKSNIRYGIKDVYNIYIDFCKTHRYKYLTKQVLFKKEFEKLGNKYDISKGIHFKTKKSGKRGYKISIKLINKE
tara:strand:+ start:152 stop:3142 length:2991 start_codon:yes stop_codon:yes gene_type:complete